MARAWPIVERQMEFDAIVSSLGGTSPDGGVVLTGAAGVGKTTLARQATESLPGTIRWVAGTESARNIPLGAFAHFTSGSNGNDPVTFLSTAREALMAEAGASDGMVVVGVDDAHLLDHLSATLLHQLAIDRTAQIVATVRTGEKLPDAVVALWKDGYLRRIDLTSFTKKQSIEFIEAAVDGPIEGLSGQVMWSASRGNALFLRHLIDGTLESGALTEVRGVWQLRGRTTVTSELSSVLERRLEQLPDDVLHVLRLLTFCEPVDAEVLAQVVGEDAVDDAEARHLVTVSNDGSGANSALAVRFTHPLFGEVVRARMGRNMSRRLSGQLVSALSSRPVTSALDRIRLAELTLVSDRPVDAKLLGRAAQDAIVLADVPLGERFARAALDNGGGVRAGDALARALLWQGRANEVEDVLCRFDPESLDEVDFVRWGLARFSNMMYGMGDADSAGTILAEVEAKTSNPMLKTVVSAVHSAYSFSINDLPTALRTAQSVWDAPESIPAAIEWAAHGGGNSLALMGRGASVKSIAERARSVESRTDALLRFPWAYGEILSLTMLGQLSEARARAEAHLEFSAAGQYLAWGMANSLVGSVDVAEGRFRSARPHLEQCLAALNPREAGSWSFPARIAMVQTYSVLGRVTDATHALADADRRTGKYVACYLPQLELARAWLAAAEDGVTEAVRLCRGSAENARLSEQFGVEAEALHAATRFGDTTTHARLAELAGNLEGILVPVYAQFAAAFASGRGDLLERAAETFLTIGTLLSAADAFARAATAYSSGGERNAHVRTAAAAADLASKCGGVVTPALRSAAHPLPLTSREREIASLVAAGLTNKQIAVRLTVSVRTVEGHLYRACIKLDATDRDDLARMLLYANDRRS